MRKKNSPELKSLANSVGDFIRYWGFRRIHGQLWTQIYLSAEPMSGSDLCRNLSVSKALVSPALGELLAYDLIKATNVDGRTKRYFANPDVFEVIKNILRTREQQLIKKAHKNFERLKKSDQAGHQSLDTKRMDLLEEMILAASTALEMLLLNSDTTAIQNWNHSNGRKL